MTPMQKLSAMGLLLLATAISTAHAQSTQPGSSFKDCPDCPEMVIVPGGSYWMGSAANEGRDSERPRHQVTVPSFAAGRYPVTVAEFQAYLAARNSSANKLDIFGGGNRPAVNISRFDATNYAAWLSRKTGKQYRLLSEAEWEYAARAGSSATAPAATGNLHRFANIEGTADGFEVTSPVGSFPANTFGLYDMIGNVWEWVDDCYTSDYNDAPTDGSARQDERCFMTVLRGGSYYSSADDARFARRRTVAIIDSPEAIDFGFRLAWTPGQQYESAVPESAHLREVRSAAQQGDAKSQTALGNMYHDGFLVEKDITQALEWYRKAAGQGYADGQYRLGHEYATGHGVTADLGTAIGLFHKAAAQGHHEAQFRLYQYYSNGQGVAKDPAKAQQLLKSAADGGYDKAQLALGELLVEAEDYASALPYVEAAAGAVGSTATKASYYAAFIHYQNDNYSKAAEYAKASATEYSASKALYGLLLLEGKGVNQDLRLAERLLRETVEKGNVGAMFTLAEALSTGQIVPKDLDLVAAFSGDSVEELAKAEAIQLYEKLAAEGYTEAEERLRELR